MSTIVEKFQELRAALEAERDAAGQGDGGRNIAISITELESSQMRYVRGRSILDGNFREHDPAR